MTHELSFSNAEIFMARSDGQFIVWDKNIKVFGSGYTFPEALHDLARNFPENYHEQ